MSRPRASCLVTDCGKPYHSKGYCSLHAARVARHGIPHLPERLSPQDAFWKKVDRSGGLEACWPWTGWKDALGYGRVTKSIPVTYGTKMAHRVAYELATGARVPSELHMDHLCRNTSCCNPAHLEPVTVKVNTERGINGVLGIYCANGHKYIEGSFYVRQVDGSRVCRACRREITRRRREDARYAGTAQTALSAQCSACDRAYGLRPDGTVATHTLSGIRNTPHCPGSRQNPRSSVRAAYTMAGYQKEHQT